MPAVPLRFPLTGLLALMICSNNYAQKVGIGTDSPAALLHVHGTGFGAGNVLFTGSYKSSSPGLPPATGAGTRMMWYPDKAAFRAGHLDVLRSTNWDEPNIGNFSIGLGPNVIAKGVGSVALGADSRAEGYGSVSLGGGKALGSFSLAVGPIAYSSGYSATAIGESVYAETDYSIAMGVYATASGSNAVAIGNGVYATGSGTVAFGTGSLAQGTNSHTLGRGLYSNAFGGLVVGRFNDSIVTRESAVTAGSPIFIVGNGADANNRSNALVVRANERVGIGTNNPQFTLALLEDNLGIGRPDAGNMAFYTSGVERIRVSPSGLVGIGTNSPATLLEVRSGVNPTIRISNNTSGAARLEFFRAGANFADWRLQGNGGAFLIGRSLDDLATVVDLYQFGQSNFVPVTDNALALGATSNRWTAVYAANGTIQTSDARLKEGIVPVPYGLDAVMQMNPVLYHWKNNPTAPANLGFLAQQMQTLVPETVYDPGDGTALGMKYAELIPVLVKAIQDLKTENETYRDRLEKLEKKLANNSQPPGLASNISQ